MSARIPSSPRILVVAAAAVLFTPAIAAAQASSPPVSISSVSSQPQGLRQAFDREAARQVEAISPKSEKPGNRTIFRARSRKQHALYGTLVGGVAGAFAGMPLAAPMDLDTRLSVAAWAGIGAGVGALIGALVR